MSDLLFSIERTAKLVQGFALFKYESNDTISHQFEQQAARKPSHAFLLYGDERYTYDEANRLVNKHAHAYKKLGVGKGDTVALLLENRPAFLWHLFGLNKIGAVASLINTNLTGDALAHAVKICEPKRVLVGSETWSTVAALHGQLRAVVGDAIDVDQDPENPTPCDAGDWAERLTDASDENPADTSRQTLGDICAYIYTSGTTGLPKAALIPNHRIYRAGRVWSGAAFVYKPDDVLYNCLPLYHSNSVMLATGSVVTAGVTMVLARKFSRTRFWDDARRYGATNFIYIGELCRYLLNTEPSQRDREHKIRSISGNGLRPDIWEAFQQRFGIERIAEFYGATEGNCITVNISGTLGSVGSMLPGMALARWDEDADDFARTPTGFMIPAGPGEKGVLLGKIRPKSTFDGYKDPAATEKKLLRNVFKKGDAYFNSGDMMRRDTMRRLYFVDRLGDTFRWKGENVSTTEVQEQISKWAPVHEVNVYGVAVDGMDGKAGMAALVLGQPGAFDPDAFRDHVDASLPGYARPVFVRLQSQIETTGTLKMKKTDLQKQGFDPAASSDPVYVRHPELGTYVRVDAGLHEELRGGKLRL
jgi:acyl-CoA synthetase (AMP-forming)/AMP-acid ligase II